MYQPISKGEVHTMNYAYTYTYTPLFSMILPILALLLILAGGIALYTLFVRKPNHYHGAAAKLHDFLNFRHAYTEGLLKILYCMTVAALAVYSVILLFFHFFWAILLFIVGNIAARLGYEFIMMLFSMHRTLRSIDRKMPEPQPRSTPFRREPIFTKSASRTESVPSLKCSDWRNTGPPSQSDTKSFIASFYRTEISPSG